MNPLSDILPHVLEAAERLRQAGDAQAAQGLEALVQRLQPYHDHSVESLPLKGAHRTAPAVPPQDDDEAMANDEQILSRLSLLFQNADQPGHTLTSLREQIEDITAEVRLQSLRRIGKTFLNLPLAKRSKQEILDLIYSQIARRKERSSW